MPTASATCSGPAAVSSLVIVVIGGIVLAGLHTKKSAGASDVLPASAAVSQAVATTATSSLSAQPDLSKVTGPPSALTTPALKDR